MRLQLHRLLATPPAQLSRMHRFLVLQLKMWLYCARLLRKNRAGQQAATLAYHTLFGLVPLVLVMVMVFQSLPGYRQEAGALRVMAYKQLSLIDIRVPVTGTDGTEDTILLTTKIEDFIDEFFESLNTGSITLLGAVLVIWAALGLLITTERGFNNIWHVTKGRSWVSRILNYWGLLTLGPLLLALGVHLANSNAILGQMQQTLLPQIGPHVLPYLVTVVAFFLLYFMLPNATVSVRAALWGAAVAALVWSLAKWGFGQYVTKFIPYSKIYGVIGLIPLTVFWIHATWLIVLFGLQLTFTTQHLTSLDAAEMAAARGQQEYFVANDLTVINLLREVGRAFENEQAPVSAGWIGNRLDLPAEFGQRMLDHLVDSGLLVKTCEPTEGYVPARAPEHVSLAHINQVVARVSFSQDLPQGDRLHAILDTQRLNLTEVNLKQLLDDRDVTDG
ncbi:YhjD/YihY/BrkB family envelope integrity protein [Planctomycetota bacterium]